MGDIGTLLVGIVSVVALVGGVGGKWLLGAFKRDSIRRDQEILAALSPDSPQAVDLKEDILRRVSTLYRSQPSTSQRVSTLSVVRKFLGRTVILGLALFVLAYLVIHLVLAIQSFAGGQYLLGSYYGFWFILMTCGVSYMALDALEDARKSSKQSQK